MDFINEYFIAERNEAVLFCGIGLIAIAIALWCLEPPRKPFSQGAAFPLIAIATIQLFVGSAIFLRSPLDSARVTIFVEQQPQRLKHEELPRMNKVMANFRYYRGIEIGLCAIALLLGFVSRREIWQGVGVGLFTQASLMLVLDYFAEQRGQWYLSALLERIHSL